MNTELLKNLRLEVIASGLKLIREGLVARTWGNVSVKVDEEHMLITPSGRKYEDLTEKDIVLVNFHTLEYEGEIKPSSEFKLHAEIYKSRPGIAAVIHTHQMNASTCAAARREVPPILDDMAQIIGPSVRVAPYALPSTRKIVKGTVKALKGRMAALMANHGAVCIGRDLDEAFVVCQVLEKACKAFIEAEFLGGAKSINRIEASMMHQFYLKKYSAKAKDNR
ncbi:MAG: class II aldolase/adducin family protein [Bacteroidota bacterium]